MWSGLQWTTQELFRITVSTIISSLIDGLKVRGEFLVKRFSMNFLSPIDFHVEVLTLDETKSFLGCCELYEMVVNESRKFNPRKKAIGNINMYLNFLSPIKLSVLPRIPCDNIDSRREKKFPLSLYALPYGARWEAKNSIGDMTFNRRKKYGSEFSVFDLIFVLHIVSFDNAHSGRD